MGASGSGKTTLLNCLSGLDEIDDGRVLVDGHSIHELSDAQRTRHRAETMGFIFQAFNLIPVFTATENVELPLLLARVPEAEARAPARETLTRVGLGHRLDRRPPELSGGEQQRVAIARALAGRPRLVWADEPTGNLDSEMAAAVMDLLCELHEEGLTLVLITHDPTVAARADRLITVKDGEIVADEHRRRGGSSGSTGSRCRRSDDRRPHTRLPRLTAVHRSILVRRPVLRRLALRNAVRRPREAALVVLGSLLGAAIITGSLVVGDTMDASIRQVARTHLGPIDELVTTRGADGAAAAPPGAPARSSRRTSTACSRSRRSRPRVTSTGPRVRTAPRSQLLAVDFAGARRFGGDRCRDRDQRPRRPGSGTAAITADLARALDVGAGRPDRGPRLRPIRTRARRRPRPAAPRSWPASGSAPSRRRTTCSSRRQTFDRHPRRRRRRGAADLADRGLEPRRRRERSGRLTRRRAHADRGGRRDGGPRRPDLRRRSGRRSTSADAVGEGFTSMFTAMGSFGVLAGLLLLVNLFVMLAAERKTELGMARAVGMRRAELVGAFATEGWLYALVATRARGRGGHRARRPCSSSLSARIFATEHNRFDLFFTLDAAEPRAVASPSASSSRSRPSSARACASAG